MNEMLETLFMNFLESHHTGPLAAELHRLGGTIDQQIDAGAVDADTIADYEYAAMKYGFAAGFAAAMELANARRVA